MNSIKPSFIALLLTLLTTITSAQPLRPFPIAPAADTRFDPTGWIAPNAPDTAAGDLFGFSVAVTGSNALEAIAIIGAPHATVNGQAKAGLVYVYGQSVSGDGSWDYITTISAPTPTPNAEFGYALDILYENGDYLIAIGAPGAVVGSTSNAGEVYIYHPDGSGGWTHVQTLVAPVEIDGRYGSSVALANLGDNVGHLFVGEPVGIGNIHFYTQFSGTFSFTTTYESPQSDAGFGHAIEVFPHFGVPDKYDFLVSAPYQDDTGHTDNGAIYHYAYDGSSSWELEDTILSEFVEDGALFGWSMDVYATSPADARLVVGVPNYELYDADIDSYVMGAGIIELFYFDDVFWLWDQELSSPLIQEDMNFGAAVSITQLPDANYSILVGQPHGLDPVNSGVTRLPDTPGAVHQFLEESPSSYILYTTLDGRDLGMTDHYGFAIADATLDSQQHILIGAPTATHPLLNGNPTTGGVDTYYPNQPAININIDGGGILEISEDGLQARFYINLNTRPADATTTTIQVITDDQCYAYEEIGTRPPDVTLNFSSSNWSESRGVIIVAENDTDAEGLHACTISFILTSDDPDYTDLTIPPLTAYIIDDEQALIELVRNSGMEDPVAAKPFKPINWTFRKLSPKDKRICPGSGSPKVFSGDCSVQMNGTADAPRSVLRSTRTKTDLTDNLNLPLAVGDTLRVQFKYRLHRKTDALVRLVAFRNFGGDRTVLARVELPHPLDEDYTQWLTFDQTFTLTTTDFKQLRLIFRDLSKGGTWWIDDVSLLYTPTGGGERFRAP